MNDFKHWEIGDWLIKENDIRYYNPRSWEDDHVRNHRRLMWFDDEIDLWEPATPFVRAKVRVMHPQATSVEVEEVLSYILDMAPHYDHLRRPNKKG